MKSNPVGNGLSESDLLLYAKLDGRSGGQTFNLGLDSGDGGEIHSTAHATKGTLNLCDTAYVDEVNNRFGLGTITPSFPFDLETEGSLPSGVSAAQAHHGGTGTQATQRLMKANGTIASPTVIVSGDAMGGFQWAGYDSSGFDRAAQFFAIASENWSDTNHGVDIAFRVTANGSASEGEVMRLYNSGGLVVGSPTGGDKGAGAINAEAVYDDNVLLTCYVFDAELDGDIDNAKWDDLVPNKVINANIIDGIEVAPEIIEVRTHDDMRKFKARLGSDSDPLDIDKYADHWKTKRHLTSMPSETKFNPMDSMATGSWIQRLIETVEIQAIHISQLNDRIKLLEV